MSETDLIQNTIIMNGNFFIQDQTSLQWKKDSYVIYKNGKLTTKEFNLDIDLKNCIFYKNIHFYETNLPKEITFKQLIDKKQETQTTNNEKINMQSSETFAIKTEVKYKIKKRKPNTKWKQK
jgi:hypothetical protein